MTNAKQNMLRALPSVDSLLRTDCAAAWLASHPRGLVVACIREALEALRRQIRSDESGACGPEHVTETYVLQLAGKELTDRAQPHVREAINATGIVLHTALGRAVLPGAAVDDMINGLKGYVTLAIDRHSGTRSERDQRVEGLLCEITGAEAATVVNNNAAATMLVLAALAAGREVVVSRGQLIEIGGSFRLPDVMAQSGARMVEIGTTNRTHLRDYERAIGEETAMLFRAHPSNFRVVGFTGEVPLGEMVELGRRSGLSVVDDLGAGALVDLEKFHLPHEPTVQESVAAGADVVLASTDKLIGGPQGGMIVGRAECIERIRRHPLARALRVDKMCLMALERTLMLFRDEDHLAREHPLYRMLSTTPEKLLARAESLRDAIAAVAPSIERDVRESFGYLGSGSLPMERLPSRVVAVRMPEVSAEELARRLRLDDACVFTRIESGEVMFDARTITDGQVEPIAAAIGRAVT